MEPRFPLLRFQREGVGAQAMPGIYIYTHSKHRSEKKPDLRVIISISILENGMINHIRLYKATMFTPTRETSQLVNNSFIRGYEELQSQTAPIYWSLQNCQPSTTAFPKTTFLFLFTFTSPIDLQHFNSIVQKLFFHQTTFHSLHSI